MRDKVVLSCWILFLCLLGPAWALSFGQVQPHTPSDAAPLKASTAEIIAVGQATQNRPDEFMAAPPTMLLAQAADPASQPHPPLSAAARPSAEEILTKAYHLEPHTLKDDAAFKAYDAEIIAVWEVAKKKADEFVAALQKMLPGQGMIPYFYYDGAILLLSLQDTPSNAKLAASCLVKGDPRDVRGEPHLRTLIDFGRRGLDVTAAALQILDHDDQVFLTSHMINLGQNYCFIYAVSQLPVERVLAP